MAAICSLVAGLAAAAPAASAAPPRPAAAGAAAAAVRHVTLATGERLLVRGSGTASASVIGRLPGGPSGAVDVLRQSGHVYAIPRSSAASLAVVDRSLFDVGSAAANGAAPYRVVVQYASAPVSIPGLTITARSGPTGTGRITDSAKFSAALAAGLHGVRRLAPVDAPASVRPAFVMNTLVVRMAALPSSAGRVLAAVAIAIDVDDVRRAELSAEVGSDGTARMSVPTGHYLVWGMVYVNPAGGTGEGKLVLRVPVHPDVTVAGPTTTDLDPGRATTHTAFVTPTATALQDVETSFAFGDGTRRDGLVSSQGADEGNTLFQPVTAPRFGTVSMIAGETRAIHVRSTTPTPYNLSWSWPTGIPTDMTRTIATGDLVPVTDTYYGAGSDATVQYARVDEDSGVFAFGVPISSAVVHSYLYGPPATRWALTAFVTPAAAPESVEYVSGVPVRIPQGRGYLADWSHGQLAPAVPDRLTWPDRYCAAARTDDYLGVSFVSGTDDPAEQNDTEGAAGGHSISVSQDGTRLPAIFPGFYQVDPGRHTYSVTATENRARMGFVQSGYSLTRWTFDSTAGDGNPVPRSWACGDATWTVLPMLVTHASVPITTDGTVPAGPVRFPITVAHTVGAQQTQIARVSFGYSTDGGHTWTPATVSSDGARWIADLDLSSVPVGTSVSIRTAATDTAGSSILSSTTNAFTVAGSNR